MTLSPMLCEPIEESALDTYLASEDWAVSQKLDGVRLLVHINDGKITPVNRRGEMTDMPRGVGDNFTFFSSGTWAFDGELVDGQFWIFDMPIAGAAVSPEHPFEHRWAVLEAFFGQWNPGSNIRLTPHTFEPAEKCHLVQAVRDNNGEGVVLKRGSGRYLSGKRSRDQLKVKFWKSADVVLSELGREGKTNAVMSMFDAAGQLVEVGTVSVLGERKERTVTLGCVAEVKYLYSVNEARPRLYQPAVLRVRSDKLPSECTLDQIQFTSKLPLGKEALDESS